MGVRTQAFKELWSRYKTVFSAAWARKEELTPLERQPHEYEFLPATLALQETPVHPAPKIIMRAILSLILLLLLWSFFGKLDVVATSKGKIVPDSRSKTIQPLETASVVAIHVSDGASVKAGDILIELDATATNADIARLKSEYETAFLDATMYRALLGAQKKESAVLDNKSPDLNLDVTPFPYPIEKQDVESQKNLALGQLESYKSRAYQLAAAVSSHEAEQRSAHAIVKKYQETLPIIQKREQDLQKLLDKNFVSNHDYLELKKTLIEQERDLNAETERLAQITSSRIEAERESQQFYAETRRAWLDKLHESEQRAAITSQELIKASARGELMRLTAPVDGTVQQLDIHTVGGVVTPAQPLMVVVPTNSPIEVEAYLGNTDIGFVYPGQQVEVKIDTFSFTKYGTVKGEVISVSSDAIKDEKLGLVFSVKIRLAHNTIFIDGNRVSLTPGMAVTAEIKIAKRRVIEYFFDPLKRHMSESLRER